MVWHIQSDDGKGPTSWDCVVCRFSAQEDESKEQDCAKCGGEKAAILLTTTIGQFRWCVNCGPRSDVTPPATTNSPR